MSETKTIKGQIWVDKVALGNGEFKDNLVQEQILIVPGSPDAAYNTVVLIEDIWSDLTSASGTYQSNARKDYFYWEFPMTDSENDDVEIQVKIECPKPKEGLYVDPETGELVEESDVEGDYSLYWLGKLKQAEENSKKYMAIQRKEVTFPGTTYVSQDGSTIAVEDTVYKNSDLGDITNLLSLF